MQGRCLTDDQLWSTACQAAQVGGLRCRGAPWAAKQPSTCTQPAASFLARSLLRLGAHPAHPLCRAAFPLPVPQGLAFLHSHNVLHLDIKPDNIYLSAVSGLPEGAPAGPGAVAGWATCRIGDFGLAVAREQNGSMVRRVLGRPPGPVTAFLRSDCHREGSAMLRGTAFLLR